MRLVIIQRIFSDYNKPIFNKLSKRYDLTLLHGEQKNGIKQVITSYSKRIRSFKYSRNPTNVWLNVFCTLKRIQPEIIVHENSIGIISLFPLILYCKLKGIKLILWGHGFNRHNGFQPKKNLLDKLRLFYMNRANAILLYGYGASIELGKYIKKEKLFVAPNTIDTTKLTELRNVFDVEGKENIKKRLGFKYKYNLVFIGRLLKLKHPEKLIDLFQIIRKALNENVGIHYIGNGEMKKSIETRVKEQSLESNIFLHGELFDEVKTGEMLYSSDIMIMPGYVGLSVNHAFCFDCPVVTFKNMPHSPEVEYIVQEKTGYLADHDDIKKMASWVINYLDNPQLQIAVKENIRYIISNICSLQNMEAGFSESIAYSAEH